MQSPPEVPSKTPHSSGIGLRTSGRARKSGASSWWTAEASQAPTVNKFVLDEERLADAQQSAPTTGHRSRPASSSRPPVQRDTGTRVL